MYEVEVSGFGPVANGVVRLRPLTVFIGPNNSGKSYLAMLLYALAHAHPLAAPYAARMGSSGRPYSRYYYMHRYAWGTEFSPTSAALTSFRSWLKTQHASLRESPRLQLRDLPPDVQASVLDGLRAATQTYVSTFTEELTRSFTADLPDLVNKTVSPSGFDVLVRSDDPSWTLNLRSAGTDLVGGIEALDLSQMSVSADALSFVRRARLTAGAPHDILVDFFSEILWHAHLAVYRHFLSPTYYLPAARSGILQSHKALARLMISRAPRVGIERMDIPQLSGVVRDFIAEFLALERTKPRGLSDLATLLESEIIGGTISIDASRLEYPEVYYERNGSGLPLHRTSSMVSELAPVSLFLKYLIEPGDFLIIEEPESHLHPDNQRKIARLIVRLIRKGVRVLVTTHSDYFFAQLNNFFLMSAISADDRLRQGYGVDDYLLSEDVSTYLFEMGHDGSVVRELPSDPERGLAEAEFSRVAEALYQESVRLERRV